MASRLLSDSILSLRPRPPAPAALAGLSRVVARRALAALTVLGLLLFLYLAEVSQGTTTALDIEELQLRYRQVQEDNREVERQISELESPAHVLRYAEAHGMGPRGQAEYLTVSGAR